MDDSGREPSLPRRSRGRRGPAAGGGCGHNPLMKFVTLEGRRYAQFQRLGRLAGLAHGFATRPLDVSARSDLQWSARAARRAQMARDLGLDAARLHHCVQIHAPRLERVLPGEPGRAHEGCDGLLTDARGAGLMTFSADCPLVLVYDPARRALGMCHASWRCTVARITAELVTRMATELGSAAGDLQAGIGPSAGPCCYEVKDDVYAAAAALPGRERLFPQRGDRMYFDLWAANAAQLAQSGVPQSSIEIAGVCTMCAGADFYSFRREGAGCGHFGLLAGLL